MMNKSKIDWCDFSWNPVTGCRHGCEYCYARKQARRFAGDIRVNLGDHDQMKRLPGDLFVLPEPFKGNEGRVLPCPAGFEPTLHEYRLQMPAEKKKPANIFVCSMADLFGEWVPDEWIKRVFDACEAAPQHNYLFLTKNPKRYKSLASDGILPERDNFWYGSSTPYRDSEMFWSDSHHTFVSIEPIQEDIEPSCVPVDWVIVGAETGISSKKVTPKREWIDKIASACCELRIPFLIKNSKEMRAVWGEEPLIQEFPPALERTRNVPLPHCKECPDAIPTPQGKRGTLLTCGQTGQHILGRYARTSPEWCPRRNEE